MPEPKAKQNDPPVDPTPEPDVAPDVAKAEPFSEPKAPEPKGPEHAIADEFLACAPAIASHPAMCDGCLAAILKLEHCYPGALAFIGQHEGMLMAMAKKMPKKC